MGQGALRQDGRPLWPPALLNGRDGLGWRAAFWASADQTPPKRLALCPRIREGGPQHLSKASRAPSLGG